MALTDTIQTVRRKVAGIHHVVVRSAAEDSDDAIEDSRKALEKLTVALVELESEDPNRGEAMRQVREARDLVQRLRSNFIENPTSSVTADDDTADEALASIEEVRREIEGS